MSELEKVADGVWLLRYPLRLVGLLINRNVTVIRLNEGRLVVHSTAPFTADDVAAIKRLGQPGWLVDATLFHDSFASEGIRAFSDLPYFVPRGFKDVASQPLDEPPAEWVGELDVLRLDGVKTNEHVLFHRPSKTLIVCDLLFNFAADAPRSTRFFARHVMRLRDGIGMSAFFRLMIRDRAAFQRSLERMMAWDFERIVVGHGEVILSDAKQVAAEHFAHAGFAVR